MRVREFVVGLPWSAGGENFASFGDALDQFILFGKPPLADSETLLFLPSQDCVE